MEFIIAVLLGYLLIGTTLSTPIIWLGRNRISLKKSDLFLAIIPLLMYILIQYITPGKGGGANFVVESLLMALLLPIAASIRFIVKTDYQRILANLAVLILSAGLALGLRLLFPAMPD